MGKDMKYCFDGRFLSSMSSGVDRYAYQILNELDKICKGKDIGILVPANAVSVPEYRNIKVIRSRFSQCWTQGVFGLYTRLHGYTPVNLCNEASMIAPKGIVCLHDVCYAETADIFPQINDYPPEEILWFNKVYKRIKKKADTVITVSQFSKGRIEDLLKIDGSRIQVIGNGWQHFKDVVPDESCFKEYPSIKKGEYYFTLTSCNKNKNVNWVLKCARANPEDTFVIAGKNLDMIIGSERLNNVIYVGFASDGMAKALMTYCKAFIFPSYYEGFGIPPLEALSVGAKIIVSDRASLPEIFGKAAVYISPDDPYVNLSELMKEETTGSEEILDAYSWEKQAYKLNQLLV